jgi:putative addiction module CopG family antidote
MATFPPDLEAYIQQKVASGQFSSPHELTVEAVRIYRELEARRAQLKSDVQAAIDESRQGLSEPLDMEAIKAELRAKWNSRGRSS